MVELRRSDLENAIGAIGYAHAYYCVSPEGCDCHEVAARLRAVANELPEAVSKAGTDA